MRSFRITVDGRAYHVLVEELDEGSDRALLAPAAPAPAGAAHAPSPAPAPPPAAAAAPPAAAAGAGAVVAPLGGVVNSVDVTLGRDVKVGDTVATIEAMKMKTPVRSQFAGKVTNIAVTVNQSVETGQLLMTVL
ncbi:MAG: biotin/lipoyl-binding protein [Acetobacteraceae bacterium]|nr:biotin/lipoyl-binding protein [Acetobacteraceae bacterium]